ncbi:MAG: MATE family efflux transporter [Pseudomonadales bacterium]|nr:MATE family efflux transporter [Pseudomonadales bacterium]
MTDAQSRVQQRTQQRLSGASVSTSLLDGSIPRQLFRLTVPMLLGISSMMIASLIDTYYVGQIGTVELAALTLTFPLVMGFSSLSMGFGIGATSIISRTVGAGDWAKAQRIATHTLILVIGFVSVLTLVGYAFAESIFVMLNAREELLPIAVNYTYITLLGVPILAVPMVGGMMLRSFNDVRSPAIIMVSGAAIQVIIAPILIWGVGSWEGFGVYGSAWSFVISRLVVAFYAIGLFRRRGLIQHPGSFEQFRTSVFEVMRLALPSMASQVLMPVSMYLIMMLVALYDNHVVAAYGVATRIEAMTMIVVMAMSSSMGPFVGQNFGARRFDRIKSALRMCYLFCLSYGLVVTVILVLLGGAISGVFRDDPAVVAVATEFFYIVPVTIGIMSVSMIAGSTFVAYGEPVPSFVLSIFRMFVVLLPLCYLLNWLMGYLGIFIAIAITNGTVGFISFFWLRSMTNRFRLQLAASSPT